MHSILTHPAPRCCHLRAANCSSTGELVHPYAENGTYTFTATTNGKFYLKCDVDDHCFPQGGNMVLPVTVSGCASPPPGKSPPPPPRPSPPPPKPTPPPAAAPSTAVKVNWMFSQRPYTPVTVPCGGSLNLVWSMSTHNVLLDNVGE